MNDDPTAVADTDSVDAGSTVTDEDGEGTLVSDDIDPDASSSLYITQVTPSGGSASQLTYNSTKSSNAATITGSKGTLTIGSDGSYSYAANSDATSGDDEFTYTLTDGTSISTATLTISVTEVANNAPTITAQTDVAGAVTEITDGASGEGTNDLTDTGSFTIADLDNDSVSVSTAEGTTDAVGGSFLGALTATVADDTDDGSGQINWTYTVADADVEYLEAGETVTETFTVTVSDGNGGTVDQTVTVVITGANDAPTANNDTINVAAGTPATGNVITSSDTDLDGDSLTVSAIAEGDVGSPITGTYGTFTLNSGGSYTYTVDTLNADVIAWQSGDPALTETFTYTVSDGNGGTNTATITVNVSGQNDAPTADDNAVTTNEDTDHTFDASEFNFTDLDGDSLDHISIETLPSKGTLLLNGVAVTLGQNIPAADISTLVFRPTANANGASYDSFTFSVNDGTVDSGTYTMTVNVTAVNDAPVSSASSVTTNEDTTYTFTADDFSFTDEEGDTLSSVTVSALSGSDGTFLLNGVAITGSTTVSKADIDANLLTFVPDANENGSSYNTFTFTVNDGTTDSGSSTMTVNVTAVNDAPTITADTENDFTEGSTNSGDPVSVFNISDSETSDSNLELSISNTTYYSITNNNDGTATVTLTSDGADYVNAGNDLPSYTVTVTDESNATATATHDPTVTSTDDTPTITATTENDFTEGSTSAGDTVAVFDVDDEETADGSLVVTIVSGNDNGYYAISYDDAGTATVTLTSDGADYVNAGNDLPEYTVQVSDGSLTTTTSHNPTTLDNTKPEASDNTVTTLEDTSYTFSSNDFGFTDDDGNTLSSVTVSSLGTNGNGTFTLNGVAISGSTTVTKAQIDNGLLKFTPSSGDNGSSYNTYTFTVNDGTDDSSSSYTMTINVTAVNDAPVATDDASSVNEDSRVRVKKNGDDLINDDSDPENDSLKVTLIKVLGGSNNSISNGSSITITGTYGQLTVNSFGGYTYRANQDAADTLDTGESAKDIFVYTVSDGNGGTDTGTLTITINGVEDNPNAVKDNVSLNISENSTLTGNAITNDIDPDDSLTIVGCGQGRNPNVGTAKTVGNTFNSNYGQMTINENGSYTFVAFNNINDLLDPGQSVTEKFYYTISDGNSTSTAMIEVTVQRDNVVQELTRKEQKQIRKQIANERLNQPSTIRLLNNKTPAKTIEQTADALDSISSTKKLSFSEGIKLVDLVAETGSLTTTDGSLDKVRAKEKDGQLNLKFKVSTDLGNQIVRYEGVMPDGSKLPDWIKVDPQTGKTTTNIPEGVEQVDFTIIAIDQQNNRKEIAVSIDPKEIKADKTIFKQAKKQNASLSVDQSGNVNIVKTNENGDVNQTETKNLNGNEKQNSNNIINQNLSLDNANDIKNILDTIKSDQVYQLQTINNGETLEIKIPETLLGNFEKTKLVLKDGSVIPDWIEFNPITGEINANPPEDVDKLEFKLIIERDGEIIVKDLAVDFGSDDNAQILDDKEDIKFIAFKDQLNKEHDNWEEYGSSIINRL
jgi:VCBS repeat-containing protein